MRVQAFDRKRILSRKDLASVRRKNRDKKIVFTNGCFDILHRGHVELLSRAKSLGDILVVGINSDDSVKRLKGKSRPFMSDMDRAEILLAFAAVDFVTIFEEDTPLEAITELEPDVLVKGAEYETKDIVGAEFVAKLGGSVVRIGMLPGYSTTSIVEKARKSAEGERR